jgi:hypothetical protein
LGALVEALAEVTCQHHQGNTGQSDTMRSPLRIVILECDEVAPELQKKYGNISDVYKRFLEAGASKLAESGLYERPSLDISSYDVLKKQEYPDIENIDAVLLTGSRK